MSDRVFSIQNRQNYSNSFKALKTEARGIEIIMLGTPQGASIFEL